MDIANINNYEYLDAMNIHDIYKVTFDADTGEPTLYEPIVLKYLKSRYPRERIHDLMFDVDQDYDRLKHKYMGKPGTLGERVVREHAFFLEPTVNEMLTSTTATKLSGPSYYARFNNILSKNILIFGEKHKTVQLCTGTGHIDVHLWLLQVVKNIPKDTTLDLMAETPYILGSELEPDRRYPRFDQPKNLSRYQSALNAVEDVFADCISRNKTHCKYAGFRYHYIDTRIRGAISPWPILVTRI